MPHGGGSGNSYYPSFIRKETEVEQGGLSGPQVHTGGHRWSPRAATLPEHLHPHLTGTHVPSATWPHSENPPKSQAQRGLRSTPPAPGLGGLPAQGPMPSSSSAPALLKIQNWKLSGVIRFPSGENILYGLARILSTPARIRVLPASLCDDSKKTIRFGDEQKEEKKKFSKYKFYNYRVKKKF